MGFWKGLGLVVGGVAVALVSPVALPAAAILATGAILASIKCLKLIDIVGWFKSKKISKDDVCKLFKEKIDNKKVKVIANIFHNNEVIEAKQWEAQELDDDLKSLFGSTDYASLNI